MKKILLGLFRVLFELLQMILRPIGRIGTGLSTLALIVFGLLVLFGGANNPFEKKFLLISFGCFMFFSILWRIGTIILPVKVKEEITVKVIDEKSGVEIPSRLCRAAIKKNKIYGGCKL